MVVDSGEAEWDLLHPRADLVNLHTERGWSSQVLRSARIICKYFPDLTNIFRGQVKLRPEPDYHGRTELVLRPVWVSWAGQLEYGEMGPRY